MTDQTTWVIVIIAAVITGIIGFFIGRAYGNNSKNRIDSLEEEVKQHKEALTHYKRDVKDHFDHTAALFVSMAGSYKELFTHLSGGYEKLAEGSVQDLLKVRVDTLLGDVNTSTAETTAASEAPETEDEIVVASAVMVEETVYPSQTGLAQEKPEADNVDDVMPVLNDVVADENAAEGIAAASVETQADAVEDGDRREPAIKDVLLDEERKQAG